MGDHSTHAPVEAMDGGADEVWQAETLAPMRANSARTPTRFFAPKIEKNTG